MISNDSGAAERAASLARGHRLTRIATECLHFDTVDQNAEYLVGVCEKCCTVGGGDPNAFPHGAFHETAQARRACHHDGL